MAATCSLSARGKGLGGSAAGSAGTWAPAAGTWQRQSCRASWTQRNPAKPGNPDGILRIRDLDRSVVSHNKAIMLRIFRFGNVAPQFTELLYPELEAAFHSGF